MTLHPEDIAATALARWLEERGAPPDELDDEVLEAVYALRPDLAPPPTVTIDEILAALDQAGPLGAWLDQDGEAPDTLDDDVAEAVYALSPERAPGPKVSIDDILARLTAGPLAPSAAVVEEHLAEIVPFPSRPQTLPEPANVAPPTFQGRPFGQERARARWLPWVVGSGAMSAMAAAALFAVVVLPNMDMSPATGSPALEATPASPTADAPTPVASAPMAEPAPEAAAAAKDMAPVEAPPALAKAPEAREVSGWWDGQEPKAASASRGDAAGEKRTDSVATATPPPPPMVAASPAPAPAAEEAEEAVADLFDEGGEAESEDFAQERTQGTSGGLFGGRDARETVADEDLAARGGAAPIEVEVISTESKKQRSAKPSAPRRSSASNMSIPEADSYDEAPVASQAPTTSTTGSSAPAPTEQERLLAVASQAEAYAAQGRPFDAARTISANIVMPASVGHGYAARATRWYLAAGRSDLAATTCDLGLALGATPSSELSAACDAVRAANRPVDATTTEE